MEKLHHWRGLALGALVWGLSAAAQASPIITPGTLTPSLNEGSIDLHSENNLKSSTNSNGVPAYVGTEDREDYGVVHAFTPGPVSGSASSKGDFGTAKTTAVLKIDNSPTPSISTTAQVELNKKKTLHHEDFNPVIEQYVTDSYGAWNVHARSNYSFQILGAPGQAQVAVNASGGVGISGYTTGKDMFKYANSHAYSFLRIDQHNSGYTPIVDITQLISNGCNNDRWPPTCGFLAVDTTVNNRSSFFTTNPSLNFSVSKNVPLFTNTVYDVMMEAAVYGEAGIRGGSPDSLKVKTSVFAYVDPMFTVNGPYTIEVSPGFGGVSVNNVGSGSVPEPSVWALMLIGFGAMSLFGLRRSRRTAWLPA